MTDAPAEPVASRPKLSEIFLPRIGGFFLVLVLALFLFETPLKLLWDGGCARAYVNGLFILREHYIPRHDFYWAINPKSFFQTYEILADMIYTIPYVLAGLNGVVLAGALAISVSIAWCYQFSRQRGMGMIPAILLSIASMYASSIHWSARPHVLTYIPFLAMYYLCFCWNEQFSKRARITTAAITIGLWANTHGSYMIGMAMLACVCASDLLPSRRAFLKQDVVMATVAGLASCLTLRGLGFFMYVANYALNPVIGQRSGEWRALDLSVGPAVWTYLVLAIILFVCLFNARKVMNVGEIAFMTLLFLFSVDSMRAIPYCALAIPVACAPAWRQLSERASGQKFFQLDDRLSRQEFRNSPGAALWVGITAIMAAVFLFVPSMKVRDFNPETCPVACSDYIISHHLDGLGFNWDNWGSYLYWKLGRGVFIDDKTDYFPRDFLEEYATLYFTHPGWEKVLAKWNFQWVLIQSHTPLAEYLAKDSTHWTVVCRDPDSVLFLPKH